jgi:peroxiredoxin
MSLLALPQMNHDVPGTIYQPNPNGVTVVEMYFNTCPYCNDNAPAVDELAAHYGGSQRVQVLDVGVDKSDSDYQSWISKHSPNHPVLKDAQRQVAKAMGTKAYPSTYVVDCTGNIVYKTVGAWSKSTEKKIYDAVEQALEVQCAQEN